MSGDPVVAALRGGRPGYVLHPNADVDCLCAAAVLAEVFGGTLVMSEGLSRLARGVATRLAIPIEETAVADLVPLVAVDWSDPQRVPAHLADRVMVVIDHHAGDPWPGVVRQVDPDAGSACEVVLSLMDDAGVVPDERQTLLLQAGLLTDTGMLKHASGGTLRVVARLAEVLPLDHAFTLLADGGGDRSSRIARLKAAARLRFEEDHQLILAWTEVSSHESHAARGLVALGADVALAMSQREGRYRISGRLAPAAADLGLDLTHTFERLRKSQGGEGGGHGAAASTTGVGIGEAVTRMVLDLIKEELAYRNR